jgi:hypothetical protein
MEKIFPVFILILLTGCQSYNYKVENGKWSFLQWDEGRGRTVSEVEGADQNSFVPINGLYAKDKNYVFLRGNFVDWADPNTFVYLGKDYGKDRQKVFFGGKELKGADPNTFQIIEYRWSKDKNDAYYESQPMEAVDVASFKILHIGILNDWAKDKSDYYFDAKKINCDYSTLKILNGSYAIDQNRAYFDGLPIEGVDVKTFRAISEVSAKDCYRDYLLERPKASFYINGTPRKSPP